MHAGSCAFSLPRLPYEEGESIACHTSKGPHTDDAWTLDKHGSGQVPGRLSGMRVKRRLCWFTPTVAYDVLEQMDLKRSVAR